MSDEPPEAGKSAVISPRALRRTKGGQDHANLSGGGTMKTLLGGACGAVVGCVTLVAILGLAVHFVPGFVNLRGDFGAFAALEYVPYLAIVGAIIGGIVGAELTAARIAYSQWKSAALSRQPHGNQPGRTSDSN